MNIYQRWSRKIADKYGLKRGVAKFVLYAFFDHIGLYQKYRKVKWRNVKRLVFVCQGNICRSPFAEYFAKANTKLEVISFGIEADGKSTADRSAIKTAKSRSIDLVAHVSRKVDKINVSAQDLLICMEPSHIKYLKKLVSSTGVQITLLGLWSDKANPFIQDPLGMSDAYFTNCMITIESAIDGLIKSGSS